MNSIFGGKTNWARLISDGWLSTGTPGASEGASGYELVLLAYLPRSLCVMNAELVSIGRRPCARGSDGVTARLSGIQLPQTCGLQTDDPPFDGNRPLVCGRHVVRHHRAAVKSFS